MKTRAIKKAPAKPLDTSSEQAAPGKTLAPTTSSPPLLFVLPRTCSPDARIVTLSNPATATPSRYYVCPEQGVYEFTRIAAPKTTPRSWLLAPTEGGSGIEVRAEGREASTNVSRGYASESADLHVATSIDPMFLLLPVLTPGAADSHTQLFLSIDDHLDALAELSTHMKHVLRSDKFRRSLEVRANAVCDSVDVGDEKMYRLSTEKLAKELLSKARRMAANGLPASMEQKLVQEALRAPEAIVKTVKIDPEADQTAASVVLVTEVEEVKSATSEASEEVMGLLRLKTALEFVLASYVPAALKTHLQGVLFTSTSAVNFGPLDTHLAHLASLRKEAQALRSLSDNISRKRSHMDDEEAEEARAEKKRKKEEDETKKKNQNRGVKQLAKVNTTGMQKLSSFFAKAPAKKAKS